MAVSDFNAPNLAPSYQTIVQQLQNRAALEGTAATPATAATTAVQGVETAIKRREAENFELGKAYLQHSFDQELQKQQQEFQKRGEVTIDEDTVKDAAESFGVDISKYKGIGINPDKLDDLIQTRVKFLHGKKMQQILNDPDMSLEDKRTRILAEAAAAGESANAVAQSAAGALGKKSVKPVAYADPTSPTGYRYAQPDEAGRYVKSADDLEAPPPSSGTKGSATLKSKLSEVDALEKLVGGMEKTLKESKGGLIGGMAPSLGKAAGLVGANKNTKEQLYKDTENGNAIALYRALTGDQRASNDDARDRAYPYIPHLSESRDLKKAKIAAIKKALADRKASLAQFTGKPLEEADLTALENPAGMSDLQERLTKELSPKHDFATPEEASKAVQDQNIPDGTEIMIGGKKKVVRR